MKSFVYSAAAVVLFFLAALGLLLTAWDPEILLILSIRIVNTLNYGWGVALGLFFSFSFLALGIYLFSAAIGFEPRLRQHIILSQEAGPIGISVDAIEDFIKRKGRAIDGIREMQVQAEMVDGSLEVNLKLVLELNKNIPDFMREFQQRLNRDLTETLGLTNVKDVNILIHKIIPRESSNDPILLVPTANEAKKSSDADSEKKSQLPPTANA
ncbi:alkaline shock response membrane anchor protein AmaP [bacterium]|nr:alkaline shock response membrane anchor protein AmaP [bacterium]